MSSSRCRPNTARGHVQSVSSHHCLGSQKLPALRESNADKQIGLILSDNIRSLLVLVQCKDNNESDVTVLWVEDDAMETQSHGRTARDIFCAQSQ